VPELVAAAGGQDVGAEPGAPSQPRQWREVAALRPDVVLIMLCGFGLERTEAELEALSNPEALAVLASTPTWFLDGNAYTSRPGPRVVDGAEQIGAAIRGEASEGIKRWVVTGHSQGSDEICTSSRGYTP
jgi:iron complex transport system substrate-binding protein